MITKIHPPPFFLIARLYLLLLRTIKDLGMRKNIFVLRYFPDCEEKQSFPFSLKKSLRLVWVSCGKTYRNAGFWENYNNGLAEAQSRKELVRAPLVFWGDRLQLTAYWKHRQWIRVSVEFLLVILWKKQACLHRLVTHIIAIILHCNYAHVAYRWHKRRLPF